MAFKKILVQRNDNAIQGEIAQLSTTKSYFQDYVNRIIALGIIVKENDLPLLFDNPKVYITNKLTQGENLSIGSLKLDSEKLFDLLDKPQGTLKIIEDVLRDIQDRSKRETHIWKVRNFNVQDNNVIINNDYFDQITNKHSLFIENDNQKQGFEKLKKIALLINEINELNCARINSDAEITDLVKFNGSICEANPNVINRFK
ncbi:MAG: hypothetical protein ACM31G_11610 [Flavobacteriales bacterium]